MKNINIENMIIGFIGGGAMAEAIIRGLLNRAGLSARNIYVNDNKNSRASELNRLYGVHAGYGDEAKHDLLVKADIIILAVKPQAATKALTFLRDNMHKNTLLISIVAGLTLDKITRIIGEIPVVRAMPNTPLAIGEGMTAVAGGLYTMEADIAKAKAIFQAGGSVITVDEDELDAVTGLAGSGPAYAFLMLEALADGGVAMGLKRDKALLLAAQTLRGAASMLLADEVIGSPAVQKDKITSPAGTTIAGLRVLEKEGVRSAFIEAVVKASERARELREH